MIAEESDVPPRAPPPISLRFVDICIISEIDGINPDGPPPIPYHPIVGEGVTVAWRGHHLPEETHPLPLRQPQGQQCVEINGRNILKRMDRPPESSNVVGMFVLLLLWCRSSSSSSIIIMTTSTRSSSGSGSSGSGRGGLLLVCITSTTIITIFVVFIVLCLLCIFIFFFFFFFETDGTEPHLTIADTLIYLPIPLY